ncbi:ribokinase (plasmid) [Streptantibioticus cattleyicolor NRRL 8057 = DSM 46488]|uniref:Ribokinase n=1 Tax=Streptantibioticus cattleyicolor (strain ATCC 35852 / DSM 46488 / JCM 4925 / NBRC 14057 / NRRL 8057) TaxID=1003195 RepID=G8XEN0_STREN|nr:ribokinase [Streptantibioticus cattleyicolor NRRL 8057 = DSM 46488]
MLHVPAYPVTPVDTTAAGDAFCGALAVALAEGHALEPAVRWACAAAAMSTTRSGAQPSLPHRAGVEAFLPGHRPPGPAREV